MELRNQAANFVAGNNGHQNNDQVRPRADIGTQKRRCINYL
jgi:hypothetical protein